MIKGAPYNLKDRKYVEAIYDYPARELVLKAGRQSEKSSIIACKAIAEMCMIPFFRVLYVTLSGKQVSDFSNDKVHNVLMYSPFIRKHYYSGSKGDLIKRITDKSLSNGSHIAMRSAFRTAETIRGFSADEVIFDETQSLLTDNILIIKECISRSKYQWTVYAGTARTSDNPIEYYWQRSTQFEWLIKCEVCGHYNYQDETILRPHNLACTKCNSNIDVRNGIWVARNKDATDVAGFRLTQYMLSGVDYSKLWEKFQTYPITQFRNEVLALPSDAAMRPVTVDELIACCNPDRRNEVVELPMEGFTIAGIDWGTGTQSFTVLVVATIEGEKVNVRFAKRFPAGDPLKDLEEIINILTLMHVKVVMPDWGFGFIANEELARKLRDLNVFVAPVYYTAGSVEVPKWDGTKYKVNRTTSLAQMFSAIKKREIEFFNWNEFQTYGNDILHIYIDERHGIGRQEIFYNHSPDKPDDFAHALNYILIGKLLFSHRFF